MTKAEQQAAALLHQAHVLILQAQDTLENDPTTEYSWTDAIERAADEVWEAIGICESPTDET